MPRTAKGKTEKNKAEVTELRLKIWAVLDESGCRVSGVTYAEAETSVEKASGTIITAEAAARLPKQN
jgi:hypothetical protein